jgi:hypothetical protein
MTPTGRQSQPYLHLHHNRGDKVTPIEHNANTASTSKTGLLVLLGGLLPAQGSGGPRAVSILSLKILGTHIPASMCTRRKALATLAISLGLLAFTAASALAATPTVVTESTSATAKPSEEVRLEATVNAGEEATGTTECHFQYGAPSVTEHEEVCEQGDALEGGEQGVAVTVAGLKAGTTYDYRVVLKNASGKEEGGEEKVTTLPVPSTEVPSPIGSTTATFKGTLTPLNSTVPAEYFFVYNVGEEIVCTGEHGTSTESAGTGSGLAKVSTKVTELEPNQKYTVCLLSTNTLGDAEEDLTPKYFETLPAPATIDSMSVSNIKSSEATLNGAVNPNNQLTECHFQYGSSSVEENTISCSPEQLKGYGEQIVSPTRSEVVNGNLVTVPAPITGLAQGTEYHYRIVTKNGKGEEATEEKTFRTTDEPEKQAASEVTGTTATLNGVLNPHNPFEEGKYEFLYKQSEGECTGGSVTPAAASTAASPQPVSSKIAGLQPGATYTFCLLQRNGAGEEVAISSPETFPTLPAAPTIVSEFTSGVEFTTATLNAQINPNGVETTYHFEYDTTPYTSSTPHGTSVTETKEAEVSIGPGTSAVSVEVKLKDLTPGTTYHYRAIATNSQSPAGTPGSDATFTTPTEPGVAGESCPNAQARTEQPYGQALPDCRAYEMVSPPEKNGSDIDFQGGRASVPLPGEPQAFTYQSTGSFSGPQGAGGLSRYLARRDPEGDRWSTQNISPPRVLIGTETVAPFVELLFTPSLSEGIELSPYVPLVEGDKAGYFNLYLGDLTSSPVSYQTVSNVNPPGVGPYRQTDKSFDEPVAAGVSTDLSHVVFQSSANLTEKATGEGEQTTNHVYEWAAGKLSQVDVSPTGTQFEHFDEVGSPTRLEAGDTWHAVSSDGSRVFFTAGEGHTGASVGQLYVRENPMSPVEDCLVSGDACTVEVSKSQKTDGTGPEVTQPAYYRDANKTGTRVFFTSRAELTNEAYTGPKDNSANLYEYNVETGTLTDLTVDNAEDGAAVLGLATASEDGSYLYFVANGVLASGAKRGNCKEEEYEALTGEHTCSLYVDHYSGGKWEIKFITTLTGGDISALPVGDETDWADYEAGAGGSLTHDFGPVQHTVRVTPDGTTLAFESERPLTGYDNERAEPGECDHSGGDGERQGETGRCREVYLYDVESGSHPPTLVCASCDPSGARPVGPAELGGTEEDPTSLAGASAFYLPRNLSEGGGRLFFQSLDPLMAHDSNGKLDVYEWEAAGEGSCGQAGGCVYPVSDVAGDFESHFMDASPNGDDVFLATADQMLPSDTDTRVDVYDARVGGGFPVSTPPPVCDNGDSCKPPVLPQPSIFAASGSATFSGLGNPASPPSPSAVVKPKPKALTRAEKLATALRACRKDKRKRSRASCERQAKKQYGSSKIKKSTKGRK